MSNYYKDCVSYLKVGQRWHHRSSHNRVVEILGVEGVQVKLKIVHCGSQAKRKSPDIYHMNFYDFTHSYRPQGHPRHAAQ